MKAPSRRGLLASAAALAPLAATGAAVAPAAASPAHPDAALIAACQAMVKAQRTFNAVFDAPDAPDAPDDDDAIEAAAPIVARWNILLDELQRLRATTAAGIAARAQALAFHAKDDAFSFDGDHTMTGRMLAYLLRDAAALRVEVLT